MKAGITAPRVPPFERIARANGSFGYAADWSDSKHHYRRLASEFIGTYGFVFALAGGAGAFHAYARPAPSNLLTVTLLTMVAAMWLVIAIYALGDVSAHFNPAMTFAYALRGDMSWLRAVCYWLVQCGGATAAALSARFFFGADSGLASIMPPPGAQVAAVFFEALLTGCFVLLVLGITRGPKLNGPFTPLAVGAFVLSFGTMGGLFDGAAFNPARALGPDVALGHFDLLWVYFVGDIAGATLAVLGDFYFRGPADSREASIAESEG